jgi:hypothetical protein
MSRSHNNQLNMVSLFDEELTTPTHKPSRKRSHNMPAPECHSNGLLVHDGPIDTYRGPEVDNSYINYGLQRDLYQRGEFHAIHGRAAPAPVPVNNNGSVSYTPPDDSDYAESDREDRRPSKMPKINKDGVPRKPRQPRPKLLKWSDNDWKNVVLGIVWACGETGVQIPFDQAAQVVGDSCTAGALQQAILKLRGKQIDEGYQIPSLRMAWTRKLKRASSSSSTANAIPQAQSGQDPLTLSRPSLIVKLKVPVSPSVVVKTDPDFNKAGADCVRIECKEKDVVLNRLQDKKKTSVPDGDVFSIDINGSKNKNGLYGFKVNGHPVRYPAPDGTASHTEQTIGVVIGHTSHPDSSSGYGPNIVEQRMPTQYPQSDRSNFEDDEYKQDREAFDFMEHGHKEYNSGEEEYEMIDNDFEPLLAGHSSSQTYAPCGSLPDMSPSLSHTYESPYSFIPGQGQASLHVLPQSPSPYQGVQGALQVCPPGQEAQRLDVGHFPDLFPHDVFSNCGFAQGSFADVFKTEAHDGYGFNAGHYN